MPSKLERSYTLPKSGASCLIANLNSKLAVIVTHPWGPLGGSMHNNVVSAAVLYFQQLGVTTLRLNFVGSQIGRGHYQVSQVQEAADFLIRGEFLQQQQQQQSIAISLEQPKPNCILLVGYSYGSLISASASATIPQCVGSVSIAPPFSVKHWLLMFNSTYHVSQSQQKSWLPKLLILGSKDNFTSEATFQSTIESFENQSQEETTTTGAILKDADHFFRRREAELMKVIGLWLLNVYSKSLEGGLGRLKTANLQSYIMVSSSDDETNNDTNNNNSTNGTAANQTDQQPQKISGDDDVDNGITPPPKSRFSLDACGADCTL